MWGGTTWKRKSLQQEKDAFEKEKKDFENKKKQYEQNNFKRQMSTPMNNNSISQNLFINNSFSNQPTNNYGRYIFSEWF